MSIGGGLTTLPSLMSAFWLTASSAQVEAPSSTLLWQRDKGFPSRACEGRASDKPAGGCSKGADLRRRRSGSSISTDVIFAAFLALSCFDVADGAFALSTQDC